MISRAGVEAKMAEYSTEDHEPVRFRDDDGTIAPFFDEEEDESQWPDVDLGGFPRGLDLVGICLRVVWKDKEILMFQTLSAALCVASLFLFLAAIIPDFQVEAIDEDEEFIVVLFKLFPYYVLAFFIATYFKAATVAVATIRMKGGEPSFVDGLEAATRIIPAILGWAIICAVVWTVLAAARRRSRGRIASRVADLAWSIATYFVVPVLLFEDVGLLDAIGRSGSIVRRTWRESLAGNLGMSAIFLVLGLVGGLVSLAVGDAIGGIVWGVVAAILFIAVLSIFSSAASAVLVAALYRLARTGKMPAPMEGYEEISDAFFAGIGYRPSPTEALMNAEELARKYAR